ncbi:MAG TPA: hypothetical protein VMU04_23175 [Candidatus Acidoferrum sp.]|nr:hypothetical protein [Candidatus Acidoferrum sp.]
MKNYLLTLLEHCSEEQFGQDAVEWAIVTGFIQLSYDLEADLRLIMGEPGRPETGRYDDIVEAYQRVVRQNYQALIESYGPVLEGLNRPGPLVA